MLLPTSLTLPSLLAKSALALVFHFCSLCRSVACQRSWTAGLPGSLQLRCSAMAKQNFPADPLDHEMLRDISNFVGGVPNSDTSYSSVIHVSKYSLAWRGGDLHFSVKLKRRDSRAEEILSHTYVPEGSALQVIRTLVACPTWTRGRFFFCSIGLDDPIMRIFSLLRSSRSLCTLDIHFDRDHLYQKHLPTLLCENLFLGTVILNPRVLYNLEDADRLALCFSRNSVLKSCTLVVDSALDFQTWEAVLRPFTANSKGQANVALKELVLHIHHTYPGLDVTSGEAIANLVRCNTTLERLEFRLSYTDSYTTDTILLAKALAVNRTLKEFSCDCSFARLLEFVGVFIPDSSGHQANTHLTTLKLVPTLYCELEDYMKELSRMLEFNTTLKHVEVVLGEVGPNYPRIVWEVRSLKPSQRHEKVCTQDILELMTRNELRLNTSLQSLVLGFWKLVRVGGEWQMSYGGPCLFTTAKYDVKVKIYQ